MMLRLVFLLFMLAPATMAAHAATLVPAGNRNAEQPPVPNASAARTRALKTTYEVKYNKIYSLIENDARLRAKIVKIARQYDIDPIHIVGAIVGEHTYNVDAYDQLQTYYVKAISYMSNGLSFSYGGEDIDRFIRRPQFSKCRDSDGSYVAWNCREAVWNKVFRGKKVEGKAFPNQRFSQAFFQPYYAGQTFGLGQLSPLAALQASDLVHKVSGLPKLSHTRPAQVYQTIMDPDITLAYVAAMLKKSIDVYSDIAGFDISRNPGITATLYNVGDPQSRAMALAVENRARQTRGEAPRLPAENYYGWLVNEKLPELRKLF